MQTIADPEANATPGIPGDLLIPLRTALAIEDDGQSLAAVARAIEALVAGGASELTIAQARKLVMTRRGLLLADEFRGLVREAQQRAREEPPHPVNVTGSDFAYSSGDPACCPGCARFPRGLYQGARFAGALPEIRRRVAIGRGRMREVSFLMAAAASTPDGGATLISPEEVDNGRCFDRLGLARSADKTIITALATAIRQLAQAADLLDATPTPDDRDGRGCLPPPLPEALPEGYFATSPAVAPEGRLEASRVLAAIVARHPRMALAVGASAGSAYTGARPGSQPHLCHLFGPAERGKTATLEAEACLWGDPRLPPHPGIMRSWDATGLGPGRRLGQLGIYPAFFDETGTAGWDQSEWGQFIYRTAQGSSRTRAARVGPGEDNTLGWAGILFTTGNGRITTGLGAGQTAGVLSRVLEIEGPFTDSPEEAAALKAATRAACGWIGPAILAAYPVADFLALFAACLAELGGAPEGFGRLLGNLGQAVAGAAAMDHVLGTGPALHDAALAGALEYLASHAGDPLTDSDRLLAELAESLSAERAAWASEAAYKALGAPGWTQDPGGPALAAHGYRRDLAGVTDETTLYVYPGTLHAITAKTGIDESTALRELYDAGHLAVPDQARRKGEWQGPLPRWAGRTKAYRIALAALDAPEVPEGEPGPAGPPADRSGPPVPLPVPAPRPAPDMLPEAAPALVPAGAAVDRQAAFLADAQARKSITTPEQLAELARALEILDSGADAREMANRLGVLRALEGAHKAPGPFAPILRGRQPYWRPGVPPVTAEARVPQGWAWARDYSGPAVALDRNAAWPAAASSVVIAHGELAPSGPLEIPAGIVAPGYYLMTCYPWPEDGMPAPLTGEPGQPYWVTAPQAAHLRDLAAAGRWPDAMAGDSWTGAPARLSSWAHYMAELRRYALEAYGRESVPFDAVKTAGAMALSLMTGAVAEDGQKPWDKCKARRPDWPQHIQAQAAVTIWRDADRARLAVPELAPVALRNTDELILPAAALGAVQAAKRPGGGPVIKLDPAGLAFGTYKIKSEEEWSNGQVQK